MNYFSKNHGSNTLTMSSILSSAVLQKVFMLSDILLSVVLSSAVPAECCSAVCRSPVCCSTIVVLLTVIHPSAVLQIVQEPQKYFLALLNSFTLVSDHSWCPSYKTHSWQV